MFSNFKDHSRRLLFAFAAMLLLALGQSAHAADYTAGVDNIANGTSTLTAPAGATLTNQVLTFINGANETARPVVNAATVFPFFTTTTYIGAVQNAADTWYTGWTCGLAAGSTC